MTGGMMAWQKIVLAAICLTAVGCRHRVTPATLPPLATAPVPIDTPPEPSSAQVQPVPLQPVQLPTVQVAPKKPKKLRKKPVAPTTTPAGNTAPAPPVLVASGGAPPDVRSIGALTAGGDKSPETHQKAVDLIGAIEKRLTALSAETAEKQKGQIVRVRYFQHEAQTALTMGDADGALTLATKAKLLLDDMEK